jgi:hypothetical protein
LPDVTILDDSEKQSLGKFVSSGGRILATGRNVTGMNSSAQFQFTENCPAAQYFQNLQKDFSSGVQQMPKDFLQSVKVNSQIQLDAPPTVAANFGVVDGSPHLFLANFTGLVPGKVAIPSAVPGVKVTLPAAMGNSLAYLPFLGEIQTLQGTRQNDRIEFTLPALDRGAIVWVLK